VLASVLQFPFWLFGIQLPISQLPLSQLASVSIQSFLFAPQLAHRWSFLELRFHLRLTLQLLSFKP
jgi:hypothetical protein